MQALESVKFRVTTEQCELLAAFEVAPSLAELARLVRRDPSVVSRNLGALSETGVLKKVNGRWVLTPLGRQINQWTRTVTASQGQILEQQSRLRMLAASLPAITLRTALVVIGGQRGFGDESWGTGNNLDADVKLATLLAAWRHAERPVYHVRHLSKEPASPLKPGTLGAEFKETLAPLPGEVVIGKSTNSAFIGTTLEATLRQLQQTTLVLAGYTGNHCVDASAKNAGDLGFSVFVVDDACVTFHRVATDGAFVRADQIHRVVMANLNQEFATVLDTATVLACADQRDGIVG